MAAMSTTSFVNEDYTCTKIRRDQIHFEWIIKNFNDLSEKNGEFIYSPVFPADESNEKWELTLYPRGDEENYSEYISIYLHPASPEILEIEVNFEISVIRSHLLINDTTTYKYTSCDGFGFSSFVHRQQLLNPSNNDPVIIRCKINILGSQVTSSVSSKKSISLTSGVKRLNHDFQKTLGNPKFSDFTIIAGKKRFKTHKFVLASRSTVLSAMLEHKNFDENRNNQLKITDIDPDVVKAMLEFIYTDEVSEIDKFAKELLIAADKYDLQGLKNLCAGAIYRTLDKENAAEILTFSDHHNADELKKYVIDYVVEHRSDVIKSTAYKSIDISSSALKEIINTMVEREKNDKK